jgi:hypothetical protein
MIVHISEDTKKEHHNSCSFMCPAESYYHRGETPTTEKINFLLSSSIYSRKLGNRPQFPLKKEKPHLIMGGV